MPLISLSRSPVSGDEESAKVSGDGEECRARALLALRSGLRSGIGPSLVRLRRDTSRESPEELRCRAGMAGFGMLVEVVNEGGAGNGPSIVFELTGSLSTALGG
jgi:hypothetical protein